MADPAPDRFLVDNDFFFDSLESFDRQCFRCTRFFSPSSRSSNKLSTEPPRFLQNKQKVFTINDFPSSDQLYTELNKNVLHLADFVFTFFLLASREIVICVRQHLNDLQRLKDLILLLYKKHQIG